MKYFIIIPALFAFVTASAQDTTGKKVRITSSFKPVLKEAAKINLTASPPATDTSRPRLQYNIPAQNLVFAFQPGTLRPLALQVDSGGRWDNDSYVKVGYGSLSTPFAQVGLSVGDGKTTGLNLYGRHTSSKGKIKYQDYSHTDAELNGFFQTGNIEWDARLGGLLEKYKKYGYQPKTLNFLEDSLAVQWQTVRTRLSFHNINRTALGISYAPEFKVDAFNDGGSNSESNALINLPLQKMLGKTFGIDLGLSANLSNYKPAGKTNQTDNFFTLSPAVLYKTTGVNLQAGIRAAWKKSTTVLFPNITAEISSSDKRISLQAGWTGRLRHSGLQYDANMNPWIWRPDSVYNSEIVERFAGIKGSVGDHFSYGAKASYNTITNQPLFTNDTTAGGKSFRIINEPKLKVLNIGGEMGYTVGEKFSIVANLQLNNLNPDVADKAWGLLPMEFNTALRLQVLKDLYVTSDLYAFNGPWYQTKGGGKVKLGSAADLSAGLEFKVVPNIKLWAQFNNLFNKEYQRWNQYPVYGFNFLGGIVFSFAQKR